MFHFHFQRFSADHHFQLKISGLILFELNFIIYQSIALWTIYNFGFESNSIGRSVRPQTAPTTRGTETSRSFFAILPPNASSNFLRLKSKVVEHSKSYRTVVHSSGIRRKWSEFQRIRGDVTQSGRFIETGTRYFHRRSAQLEMIKHWQHHQNEIYTITRLRVVHFFPQSMDEQVAHPVTWLGGWKINSSFNFVSISTFFIPIDSSSRALHFLFWVRDDTANQSAANRRKRTLPAPSLFVMSRISDPFAAHCLTGSSYSQKMIDRVFKAPSTDVQLHSIRFNLSQLFHLLHKLLAGIS